MFKIWTFENYAQKLGFLWLFFSTIQKPDIFSGIQMAFEKQNIPVRAYFQPFQYRICPVFWSPLCFQMR